MNAILRSSSILALATCAFAASPASAQTVSAEGAAAATIAESDDLAMMGIPQADALALADDRQALLAAMTQLREDRASGNTTLIEQDVQALDQARSTLIGEQLTVDQDREANLPAEFQSAFQLRDQYLTAEQSLVAAQQQLVTDMLANNAAAVQADQLAVQQARVQARLSGQSWIEARVQMSRATPGSPTQGSISTSTSANSNPAPAATSAAIPRATAPSATPSSAALPPSAAQSTSPAVIQPPTGSTAQSPAVIQPSAGPTAPPSSPVVRPGAPAK